MKKEPALPSLPTCPVCNDALASAAVVLCRSCKTPHHRHCFAYNRGCATFACGSRLAEPPRRAALDHRQGQLVIPGEVFTASSQSDLTVAIGAIILIPLLVMMTGSSTGLTLFALASAIVILTAIVLYLRDNVMTTELVIDGTSEAMQRRYLIAGRLVLLRTLPTSLTAIEGLSLRRQRVNSPEHNVVIHRLVARCGDKTVPLLQHTVDVASATLDGDCRAAEAAQELAELADCIVTIDDGSAPTDKVPMLTETCSTT